jgi:hypothetical protein
MKMKVTLCLLVLLAVQSYAQQDTQPANNGWFGWLMPGTFVRAPQVQLTTVMPTRLNNQPQFEDPLLQDQTNRFVYDTLMQRILADGAEQTKVQAESEPVAAEEQPMADQASSFQSPSKRDIPIVEALRIVQTAGLTDCVKRVICELSCNANAFGVQGRKVFKNLIKLQMNKAIQDDTTSFKTASQKGLQLKQSKVNCDRCHQVFAQCNSSSSDLVAVSAMFEV